MFDNRNNAYGASTATSTFRGFDALASQPMHSLRDSGSASTTTGMMMSLPDLAAANMRYSTQATPRSADLLSTLQPPQQAPQQQQQQPAASSLPFGQQPPTTAQQQQQQPSTSFGIQASLEKHVDSIVWRTVQRQEQTTKDLVEERVQARLKADHQIQMKLWRNELVGNRNLVDATNNRNQLVAAMGPSSFGGGGGGHRSSNAQPLLLDNGQSYGGGRAVGVLTGVGSVSGMANMTDEQRECAMEHLKIVQNMNHHSITDPIQLMDAFEKVSTLDGYHTAWPLLKAMLPDRNKSPVQGALGALDFLCRQFQHVMDAQVRGATLHEQDTSIPFQYQNARATSAASFVKLTIGSVNSVWDKVYFCLRCGDAHAARQVVVSAPPGMVDFAEEQPIIVKIFSQLASRQRDALTMFGNGVVPMIEQQDQDVVRNFYEKTLRLNPNNGHKVNVLALLSGNQMSLDGTSTVEDYLFAHQWLAVQDKTDPVAKVTDLGAEIRTFGPNHFATDGRGPWAYCMPLLATLQCQTALCFLSQAGGALGLMQAAHLGLAFAASGVAITDLGHALSSGNNYRDLSSTLLVEYAKFLEREPGFGLSSALQYVLKLPSKTDQCDAIADMIYRNPSDMGAITGDYDKQHMSRQNCLLERYFSSQEVSSMLNLAGEKFLREAENQEKAQASAHLFMVAGSYANLLRLFHRLISPPNDFSGSKNFWAQHTQAFYNDCLKQHSIVKEVLGRDQKMNLVETTVILLGLREFFSLYHNGHYREAFNALASLSLVPLSQAELEEKGSKFRDLDPLVKGAMGDTLVASVDCLYQDYMRKKSESRGLSATMQANLSELKMKARYLFLFSGSTGTSDHCRQAINEMKGRMI